MGKQLHVQQTVFFTLAGESTLSETEPDPYFYWRPRETLWDDMPTNLICQINQGICAAASSAIQPQIKHQKINVAKEEQEKDKEKVKEKKDKEKEKIAKRKITQKEKTTFTPQVIWHHSLPLNSLSSSFHNPSPQNIFSSQYPNQNLHHSLPHRPSLVLSQILSFFILTVGILMGPFGAIAGDLSIPPSPLDCAANVLPPQKKVVEVKITDPTSTDFVSPRPHSDYRDPVFLKQQILLYLKQAALDYWSFAQDDKIKALADKVLDANFNEKDADEFLRGTGRYFVEESTTTPGRPRFEGREYPHIRMMANKFGDAPLNGTSYYAENETKPKQVYVILLHGLGAEDSHAGTMLSTMDILTNPKSQFYQEIAAKLKKEGLNPASIKAEAIDLVNSGNGPWANGQQFSTLEDFTTRFNDYVDEIKQREKCPVVVLARSAAGALVLSAVQARVAQHRPVPIDGLVMVGLTHANPAIGIDSSLSALLYEIHDGLVKANYAALVWIKKLYAEMNWHEHPETVFPYLKTVIMVGEDDIEVSQEARQDYDDWRIKYGIDFIIYPHAEHDVFATTIFSKNLQKLKEANKYLFDYQYRDGLLQEFWDAVMNDESQIVNLNKNNDRIRLRDELATRDFLQNLAVNLQTMYAAVQDKMAFEEAKALKNGKGPKTEQWLWENDRRELIEDLQQQVQILLGQNNPSPADIKKIFLRYFSINLYSADFSERLVKRFERWKKEIDRYQREGATGPKAQECRQKIHEHEGVLHTMLWEKPVLRKALGFKDLPTAEATLRQVTRILANSHNPLTTSYINFHQFIQRYWPAPASEQPTKRNLPQN